MDRDRQTLARILEEDKEKILREFPNGYKSRTFAETRQRTTVDSGEERFYTLVGEEFKCKLCPSSWRSDRNIKKHVRTKHPEELGGAGGSKCPYCDYKYYNDHSWW